MLLMAIYILFKWKQLSPFFLKLIDYGKLLILNLFKRGYLGLVKYIPVKVAKFVENRLFPKLQLFMDFK